MSRALIVLTWLLAATLAIAAGAPRLATADDQRAEAERYFRAGERAYNSGNYLLAAEAFEEAYELLPVPAIAFSTAQAYRLEYFAHKDPAHLKRSLDLYRLYVEQVKTGGRIQDAVASLAELEPLLQRIEAEMKTTVQSRTAQVAGTRLMVTTQIEGAQGTIDGQGGVLPLIREVTAGEHTVIVEADGYFPVTQKATAVDGQFIVVEVDLQPQPARLAIKASGGARVAIDGRPVGTTPLASPVEVPAGKHLVTVSRRGRYPFSNEYELTRGQTLEVEAALRTTTQRKASYFVLGGAGALAVGAGVAALFALSSDSAASDLATKLQREGLTPTELERYDRLRERRDDRLTVTWGLAGGAAVTATIGVLMMLFDNPDAEMPAPSLAPAPPARGGSGLGVTVSAEGAEVGWSRRF